MKIALGTAQFGMNYGISNVVGRTSPNEVSRILRHAREFGIDTLDTAHQYGDSEKVIGDLSELTNGFRIFTKACSFRAPTITEKHLDFLDQAFKKSLKRLQRRSVEGLLIHNVQDLFARNGSNLYSRLCHYREIGLTRNIGVSLYTPLEARRVLDNYEIDVIQFPLNLMDRRMLNTGLLDRFKSAGVEIHTRSAFLQGLFFMSPEAIPDNLLKARPFVTAIQERAHDCGVSVGGLALGFLQSIPKIDHIIIGVNTVEQLISDLDDYEIARKTDLSFEGLACGDLDVIDPTSWR